MALERLQQAKALIGFLARGVRDAIRPQTEDGFAPCPTAVIEPSAFGFRAMICPVGSLYAYFA